MYNMDWDYFMEQFQGFLGIDSTTGQYREIQNHLIKELDKMGLPYEVTHKGGVIADLGGQGNPLVVTAHLDDIGLMVRHINLDGTLKVCMVGGLRPYYAIGENVRLYTRDGDVYTGSVQRSPASVHVTPDECWTEQANYDKNVVVVLDEDVKSAEDTRKLGVEVGDVLAVDPRCVVTESGYIKSRFIDDKAPAAALMAAMKYIKDQKITLKRNVKVYFAMYEEIGHGTTYLPADTKDMLALDIACCGPEQTTDERKVSIFCKDSRFPYHYEMTNELRAVARDAGIDYVMDVFTPHYGTDCDCSIIAGYDIRHSAIGPGTSVTHGYERTHKDGLQNMYALLLAYLLA